MNDKKSTLLAVVALLAIAGALTFLYVTQWGGGRSGNLKPFENLGFIAAEETATLLNRSGQVVLVAEVEEALRTPNVEALVQGFKSGLAKQSGVKLKELKNLPRSMDGDPRRWPAGHAEQLGKLGQGTAALVFIGSLPPELSAAELAALKAGPTKLVLISAQSPSLKPLLQQGVIHLAIVNRVPARPAPSRSESPRQWFDRVYLVAKPDALGELP